MKKIYGMIAVLAILFSGCILSATPKQGTVTLVEGSDVEFQIEVFPEPEEYIWSIDGVPVEGANDESFLFTAEGENLDAQTLSVKAGHNSVTWVFKHFTDVDPTVPDVQAAFESLDTEGDELAFWDGGFLAWPRYTTAALNIFGMENHFQGVQRLRRGYYLALSGSDKLTPPGEVMIVKLGSRPASGAFGSNCSSTVLPPLNDKIVWCRSEIDTTLNHPGGMCTTGDILVVPVEGKIGTQGISRVLFYDVSDPESPVLLNTLIDRTQGPQMMMAGMVAMTKLDDGRFLLAVANCNYVHFYHSRTTNIADGFDTDNVPLWHLSMLQAVDGVTKFFCGSSINFIRQDDGRLFLISFNNHTWEYSAIFPYDDERNMAYLYTVDFPGGDYSQIPAITVVAEKEMNCSDAATPEESFTPTWHFPSPCDFSAAAGAYVSPEGRLAIYSVPFYMEADLIRMKEFWSE
jgi:hypothetical protein